MDQINSQMTLRIVCIYYCMNKKIIIGSSEIAGFPISSKIPNKDHFTFNKRDDNNRRFLKL